MNFRPRNCSILDENRAPTAAEEDVDDDEPQSERDCGVEGGFVDYMEVGIVSAKEKTAAAVRSLKNQKEEDETKMRLNRSKYQIQFRINLIMS